MNKYKDAIDVVARYCSDVRSGVTPRMTLTNELDILMELIEKTTSQKPKPSGYKPSKLDKFLFGSQETYVCPTCFNQCLVRIAPNGRNENSYCYNCGQKLDWSEDDE